jgi:transposase InsO family protein
MFFVHVCRTESPVLGGNARESRITRGIQWISRAIDRAIDNVTADLGLTHDQAGLLVDRCLRKARAVVSLDELLNGEIFYTLKKAQIIIEKWTKHYNTKRPHSALG